MPRSQESHMSSGKGVIIAVNKWDAIEKNDKTTRRIRASDPSDGAVFPALRRDHVCVCADRSETVRSSLT